MTAIAHPSINFYTRLEEGSIVTLIIENRDFFSELLSDIIGQTEGTEGSFVLSDDNSPLDMKKRAEIITQFVPFTVNQKELLNKVYAVLKGKAYDDEMYQTTNNMISGIERYLYRLTEDFGSDISIAEPDDISGILKMFNVKINDAGLSLPEKLLEYMLAANEYKGERVFITVNLRSYINDKNAGQLFHDILLNKIKLICIENKEYKKFECEKRFIIDDDLCLI
ncbi:MAG: type II-A CRISPR-associated protein Csn2 [Ruminococcus sp.]|nr:type II-A CRISPR-associated protein Csn2 [Ruminococcus sp.]